MIRPEGIGLAPALADTARSEFIDTAVGVLGDTIDYEGSGWDGQPWFMLVVPDYHGEPQLIATPLEAVAAAEQMAEVADIFRAHLPIACAYVKRLDMTVEGHRVAYPQVAAVVVLDGEGGEGVVTCEIAIADDGRQILLPFEGAEARLLRGFFGTVIADALALARVVRGAKGPPSPPAWSAQPP